MYTLSVKTCCRNELIDITPRLREALQHFPIHDGICLVFIPHTTAAVTINENADPDVRTDLLMGLERIATQEDYLHQEGNSDAHLKASLLGSSQLIPVENGNLVLGTWQGVYLAEFDGPRIRNVMIKILGHSIMDNRNPSKSK